MKLANSLRCNGISNSMLFGLQEIHKHVFCSAHPQTSALIFPTTEPLLSNTVLWSNTSLHHSYPTLLSNTLLQDLSTALLSNTSLQHSCPTLVYNSVLQQFSTTLFSNSLLQNFSTTLLRRFSRTLFSSSLLHFSTTLFPNSCLQLFPNTLLQHSCTTFFSNTLLQCFFATPFSNIPPHLSSPTFFQHASSTLSLPKQFTVGVPNAFLVCPWSCLPACPIWSRMLYPLPCACLSLVSGPFLSPASSPSLSPLVWDAVSASHGLVFLLSPVLVLSPIWSGMLCPPLWSCLSLVSGLVSQLVYRLGWDAVSARRSCLPACPPSSLRRVRVCGLVFLLSPVLPFSLSPIWSGTLLRPPWS